MKRSFLWVLLAAVAVLFSSACGGGGGSSSNTGNTTATSGDTGLSNTSIITSLDNGAGFGVDLSDLAVGDQVQLRVIGINSSGQNVIQNGSNWTTTAPASVATVTPTGLLTAVGPTGGTSYLVSGRGPNGTLSANLIIKQPQAFVTGLVRNVNGTGIPRVSISFYNSSNALVGKALTGAQGTFRANLAPTATRFTIDIEASDPGNNPIYYRQFSYTPPSSSGALDYLEGGTSCLASMPAITSGSTVQLSDITLIDRASGPPPPPSGCLGG
ncbi:hypothetical protein [Fimbriimonas ginsengisoli]|uniref:BIG2 domain-containing protein n=1 Tax=Fimbriimonas ginsengisoli Gsoil 348 TaxID=661478 RepID=A0A068NSP0_FIMGI|nr:hypothetical protein [Fimbriimonas ginsengisoli]AIE86456.1 hypothetical protein OP10G_3088 [Fimbriimonas ginsengisoli Gsoil 348]